MTKFYIFILICFISSDVLAAVQTSFYDLLEVKPTATQEQIKRAYRKMAQTYHPDKNPDDIEDSTKIFQTVTEIYEVLSDPDLRKRYDSGDIDEMDYWEKWNSELGNGEASANSGKAGSDSNGTNSSSNGTGSGTKGAGSGSHKTGSNSRRAGSGSNGTGSSSSRARSNSNGTGSNTGDTILHNAIQMTEGENETREKSEQKALKMVRIVIQSGGIDINAQNNKKQTPLQTTIYKMYPAVFKLLLENGADPNIPDKNGNWPVHNIILYSTLITERSDRQILQTWIKSLWQKGADLSVKSGLDKKTPLELLIEQDLQKTALWVIRTIGTDYLTEEEIDRLVRKAINQGQKAIVQKLRNPSQKTARSIFSDCWKAFDNLDQFGPPENWTN